MKSIKYLLWLFAFPLLLSSCGKFDDIQIHGMKGVKLRGIKDGTIFLTLNLDIENPNNRKIVIKKINFTTWLKDRELGKLVNGEKIILKPNTREEFPVPIEIKLRVAADIFKLMNFKDNLLNDLTIEGYIKGCSFPVSKRLIIEKQPFTQLISAYKDSVEVKDTVQLSGSE